MQPHGGGCNVGSSGVVPPLAEGAGNQTGSPARKIRFGAFEVDLASGELRKSGLRVRLQDKPFQILSLLLQHRGLLVTREQLKQRLWPADTFVDFDRSLNTAANRLRQALGDSADHPRFVETVPRRGYRWIGPADELAPPPDAPASQAPSPGERSAAPSKSEATPRKRWPWSSWHLALLIVGLALAVLAAFALRSSTLAKGTPAGNRAVLLVLPFEDRTEGAAPNDLSIGLNREMLSQLSGIGAGRLGVVVETPVRLSYPTPQAVQEVARKVGANYVLAGTLRRDGDRLVVDAELVRVLDGATVWNGTYEQPLADAGALRGHVAGRIASDLRRRMKLSGDASG